MRNFAKSSIAIAALLSSTSAFAAPSGWTVSEASGQVTITREGQVINARQNSVVHEGDVIRTGRSSRAVLVRGEEYVVVSPQAHIRIAEPETAGPITQIFQYLGNVLFRIEKKSTPHFGVETPYMAAVVKGTTFNVSVTNSGSSVQVTEGAVEVFTSDELEAALLTPGLVGLVEADQIGDLIIIGGDGEAGDQSSAVVRGAPSFVSQLRTAPQSGSTGAIPTGNSGNGNGNSGNSSAVAATAPIASPSSSVLASADAASTSDDSDDAVGDGSGKANGNVFDQVLAINDGGNSGNGVGLGLGNSGNNGNGDEGGDEGNDSSDDGELNFAEDQENGSCAGVPNCSGGANPDNAGNGADVDLPDPASNGSDNGKGQGQSGDEGGEVDLPSQASNGNGNGNGQSGDEDGEVDLPSQASNGNGNGQNGDEGGEVDLPSQASNGNGNGQSGDEVDLTAGAGDAGGPGGDEDVDLAFGGESENGSGSGNNDGQFCLGNYCFAGFTQDQSEDENDDGDNMFCGMIICVEVNEDGDGNDNGGFGQGFFNGFGNNNDDNDDGGEDGDDDDGGDDS
ncbi:MAG: FecR family protein [Erythrobacter sp.]